MLDVEASDFCIPYNYISYPTSIINANVCEDVLCCPYENKQCGEYTMIKTNIFKIYSLNLNCDEFTHICFRDECTLWRENFVVVNVF